MNADTIAKIRYFLIGFILALGYSVIANGFLTKLIANADNEDKGFPFVIASDPYIAAIIITLSMAMGVASAIVIPGYTAYNYHKFNEYIQRLLNQMPQKPRKPKMPRNVKEFKVHRSNSNEQSQVTPDSNSYGGADPWNNKK